MEELLHLAFSRIVLHCLDTQSCLPASLRAEENPQIQQQIERRRRLRRLLPKQMPTRCVAAKPAAYFAAHTPVRGNQVGEVANGFSFWEPVPLSGQAQAWHYIAPPRTAASTQFDRILTPSESAHEPGPFRPARSIASRLSSSVIRCAAGSRCSQSSFRNASCSFMHMLMHVAEVMAPGKFCSHHAGRVAPTLSRRCAICVSFPKICMHGLFLRADAHQWAWGANNKWCCMHRGARMKSSCPVSGSESDNTRVWHWGASQSFCQSGRLMRTAHGASRK